MRKNFIVFMMLLCINLVYTSCDKDDNEDNDLIGTNWIGYYDWGTKFTFNFKDKDTCIETYYSEKTYQYEHKYKLVGNKIEIFVTDNEDKIYTTGSISGNKMILIYDVLPGLQVAHELVRE